MSPRAGVGWHVVASRSVIMQRGMTKEVSPPICQSISVFIPPAETPCEANPARSVMSSLVKQRLGQALVELSQICLVAGSERS